MPRHCLVYPRLKGGTDARYAKMNFGKKAGRGEMIAMAVGEHGGECRMAGERRAVLLLDLPTGKR